MKILKKLILNKSILFVFLISILFSNQFSMNYLIPGSILQNVILRSNKSFYFNPYILRLIYKNKRSELLYYGSYHNLNTEHPQFNDIEMRWNMFKPDIAYSESKKWPLIKKKKEAIKTYGEQGLLRFLAYRDRVKIESIDPSRKNEMRYLLKNYSLTKIKIFYVLRQITIDREIFNKKEITDDYIKLLLNNIPKIRPSNNYILSINKFEDSVKQLLPELRNWRKIDSSYFMNILKKNNILAKMNISVNKYRDKYMLNKIVRTLKKDKKIFAVVGKSHVVSQENDILSKIRNIK